MPRRNSLEVYPPPEDKRFGERRLPDRRHSGEERPRPASIQRRYAPGRMSSPAFPIARCVADAAVDLASQPYLRCLPEVLPLTGSVQTARREVPVIDLARARDERRLEEYQCRTRQVLEANKRALARLFQSGVIYSRVGSRLARDLLLAHQHLLKVGDLLARFGEMDSPERFDADAVYGEVHALLSRTTALSARSDGILARK